MKKKKIPVIILCCGLCMFGLSAEQDTAMPVKRRFALIIGNNFGGAGNETLKYTIKDAMDLAKVLKEIGGVREADMLLLSNPSATDLENGFTALSSLLRANWNKEEHQETIIYYSGHSNHQGLLLYDEKYEYTKLEQNIKDLPSKVKIVILDSCASGAFTRIKGAEFYPPFLSDTSSVAEGHAYLTSCSETEVSHESDKIKASIFTYNLLTGLRGAADENEDGNITLNEIYEYAFNKTINYSQEQASVPQHPAYELSLTGTGNLILTNIKTGSALLTVGENLSGNLYIYDAGDNLVAEIRKNKGRSLQLSLFPGYYRLVVEQNKKIYGTEFILKKNTSHNLAAIKELKKLPQRTLQEKGASRTSNISYGLTYGPEHFIDSPPPTPDTIIGFNSITALMSVYNNLQIYSDIYSIGLLTGLFYKYEETWILDYSLYSVVLALSLKISKEIVYFRPYLEFSAGGVVSIQNFTDTRIDTAVGLNPLLAGSVGLTFQFNQHINAGVHYRLDVILLSNWQIYEGRPGVELNFNF